MAASRSIKEVARIAGVSIGTVSNVLNHPHRVTEAARIRVRQAIAQLGYVRNDSARQLRTGSSRQIAILVMDVANPFFTDVVRGAEAAAEEQGILVVVCNSGDSADRERRHLDLLEEQRVLGVLIPVDDAPTSRLEQLIERGHRHIAFVGGPMSIQQVADRYQGCSQVRSGNATLTTLATASLTVGSGRLAARQIAAPGAGTPAQRRVLRQRLARAGGAARGAAGRSSGTRRRGDHRI